jgi:hypothetical protein
MEKSKQRQQRRTKTDRHGGAQRPRGLTKLRLLAEAHVISACVVYVRCVLWILAQAAVVCRVLLAGWRELVWEAEESWRHNQYQRNGGMPQDRVFRVVRQGQQAGFPSCCVEAYASDIEKRRAPSVLRGVFHPNDTPVRGYLASGGAYVPCGECLPRLQATGRWLPYASAAKMRRAKPAA